MLLLLAVYAQMIRFCALMHRPAVSGHLAQNKNKQTNKTHYISSTEIQIQTDCAETTACFDPQAVPESCLREMTAKPCQENRTCGCHASLVHSQCCCINIGATFLFFSRHLVNSIHWLSVPSDEKHTHTHTYICTGTL